MAVLCSIATAVQAYPPLYVFSDSLIDTGNNSQFTYDSNKNLLYDEVLAQHIGARVSAFRRGSEQLNRRWRIAVPTLNQADKFKIRCRAT